MEKVNKGNKNCLGTEAVPQSMRLFSLEENIRETK